MQCVHFLPDEAIKRYHIKGVQCVYFVQIDCFPNEYDEAIFSNNLEEKFSNNFGYNIPKIFFIEINNEKVIIFTVP